MQEITRQAWLSAKEQRMKFTDVYSVDMGGGKSSCVVLEDLSPILTCTHYGTPVVTYQVEEDEIHSVRTSPSRLKGEDSRGRHMSESVCTNGNGGV